ncbi:MAG: TaqI-like C-terminal specificity domain-containing protein [Saprospiraceae bacterium]|nr:TaqI-like C-terminal specificity domain-containing protein [Saprospiraceae bacterium]
MSKSLAYFQSLKLPAAVAQLFKDLDVPLNLTGDGTALLPDLLEKNNHPAFGEYVSDVYWIGQMDDNAFEGIQSSARELQQIRGKNYDTILVFALEIKRHNGLLPSRTQLFDLVRAFNREFPYQPVVLVFRYGGHLISIAVVERNDYKVKHLEGDKVGKMSLLRDVDTREKHTHAGHLRILRDMQIPRSGKNAVTNFEMLYKHWQQALNISILNKKFYQELSNWYFWAIHNVQFPGEPTNADEDTLKTHRANNVIRLITRLVFSWFLKEKKLIPDALFDIDELTTEYLKISSLTPENSETSEFYLAILQNLFFATLNQEMDARRFKTEAKVFPHPDHSIKNIYRHATLFKNKDKAVDALFKNIPFLNGGLFECLDDEKVTHDGFSETKAKQPNVPNFLFFQKNAATTDELNEDYGTKGKKYEVRGLINILNDYKFTIAENTPLEEEVALDPELLGRIFENLLASYNPETKTTARKQTGSFYTPREIVNYMVDESLIAYLKNKLTENHAGHLELGKSQVALFGEQPNKKGQISLESQPNASRWTGRETDLDKNLRLLFSQGNIQPFDDQQDCQDLIVALDTCKILDPACGSGAFPMGILLRMVTLLHKLDPKNEGWKQRQIQKAEHIEDSEARDAALEAIKKAFERNELDYGRKLFLIENCIFGVDIQPIAVQIAKLRFFISLICEQNTDDAADNRGVLALPNLETKFVAANTLIGLENATLAKQAVVDLLDERETLHHRMFSAKRYTDKKRFREKDEKLRNQIKEKLESSGWVSQDVSSQLANWNPFDQNTSGPFFDPKWMFGIDEGFDVVIGNPPYVQLQKMKEWTTAFQKQGYKTFEKTGDLYCLFYERGVNLLCKKGILTFITSSQWVKAAYGKSLRKFFLENNPRLLLELGPGVFESATVDTNILVLEKASFQKILFGKVVFDLAKISTINQDSFLSMQNVNQDSWQILSNSKHWIKDEIAKRGKSLKSWKIQIYFGIKTGFNEAFILESVTRKKLLDADIQNENLIRPVLRGREIEKYYTEWDGSYIIRTFPALEIDIDKYSSLKKYLASFLPKLNQTGEDFVNEAGEIEKSRKKTGNKWFETQDQIGFYQEFSKEKIIWKRIGSQLRFSYSNEEIYCLDSTCIATGEKIKYLTGLLNSKLCNYQLFENAPKTGMGDLIISVQALEPLLVYYPTIKEQTLVEFLVDFIIFGIKSDLTTFINTFERVLDGMVCELYFPDLMKEKEVDILAQVERDLAPYADFEQQTDAGKVVSIEALHRLWTHPDSIVRNRLALMAVRSPEVLGVILEGK